MIIALKQTYLWSIYIIKNHEFNNIYYSNIYVNNRNFISIVDNISVLQLSSSL